MTKTTATLTKGQTYDLDTLRFVGWTEGDGSGHEGYNWADYFDAAGRYLGADAHGIEPIFAATEIADSETVYVVRDAVRQDSNGKWWVHLDGDAHFDPDLITASSKGVWLYDGAPCESIMGPFDSQADAESRVRVTYED